MKILLKSLRRLSLGAQALTLEMQIRHDPQDLDLLANRSNFQLAEAGYRQRGCPTKIAQTVEHLSKMGTGEYKSVPQKVLKPRNKG